MTDPFAPNDLSDPFDPNPTTRMPLPGDPAGTGLPPSPSQGEPPTAWTELPPTELPLERPVVGPPVAPPPAVAAPPAPAWHPVRDDRSRWGSVLFGLVLVAVGAWFFAEHTLGLELPSIRWSRLWPLILIVVGVWVVFGSRRRSR